MLWQCIEECFETIDDNARVQGRCDYHLVEIITIAICAIISASETWTNIRAIVLKLKPMQIVKNEEMV